MIFVEGVDDIHFLKTYAKTVLDKDLENDKILCVIGGGGSLKNYADLNLFKKLKGNNFYSVMVDGDDQSNGKGKWCERIKAKCDEDTADFKKLSKREIENYCHPQAICRKCADLDVSKIVIQDDTDVAKHLKEIGLVKNFKNDLNIEVFNEMTKAEWEEIDATAEIKNFIEAIYTKIQ